MIGRKTWCCGSPLPSPGPAENWRAGPNKGALHNISCSAKGSVLGNTRAAEACALIGDLLFFVSPDSSDVWGKPELFLLDERRRPRFVAGVPPDYFSSPGQLWGNPVYDWEALGGTGYRWCIDRLRALLAHVDVIRLDHFRGFAAAWHVPAGAPTAQSGQWVPGPGAEFFRTVENELGHLPFIAEDLGVITPDVRALRDHFTCPERGFYSSRSMAPRTTHTCRATTSATRWCIRVRMIIPRLAAGLRICLKTNEGMWGVTWGGHSMRAVRLHLP